jgi:hypothetical protein
LAHNGKGYDTQPIAKWIIERGEAPKIIYRGMKILHLKMRELNIKFHDSSCMLPFKLKDLPKLFDLEEEKGEFPHKFNLPKN